jgi:hypothetical protein
VRQKVRPADERVEECLRAELARFERDLSEASLVEALRLLDSARFGELTEDHVRQVMEYRSIELSGERFFERAWSRGKEAGAMLGFARMLGTDVVKQNLERLRGSIGAAADPLVVPTGVEPVSSG